MIIKKLINNFNYKENTIISLLFYLPKKRKFQLIILFSLMLVNGLTEILNVNVFQEFLLLISGNVAKNDTFLINSLQSNFNLIKSNQISLVVGIILISSLILTTSIKTYILYLTSKVSSLIGKDLSYLSLKKYLLQDYEYHLNQNSNKMITLINVHIQYATVYIMNLIEFIFQSIVIIFLIYFLFKLDFFLAIIFSSTIVISYVIMSFFIKKRVGNNGIIISQTSDNKTKSLLESIGHIKEILLSGKQNKFISKFMNYEEKFRLKNAENGFIPRLPRYIIEAIALIIFAFIGMISTLDNNLFLSNLIALLGTFALACQKLLQAIQGAFHNWSTMLGRNESLKKVLNILSLNDQKERPKEAYDYMKKELLFSNSINLNNVSYKYPKSNNFSIQKINLKINKGEKIGIIGKTGSGKTTLVNIIISLLKPKNGQILIDNQDLYSLKNKVKEFRLISSYVPQNIYLSDNSIKNNIIFGLDDEKIDYEKFKDVIEISQLKTWINSLPLKENTIIGENAKGISGGQKQRIAIARALYSDSKILIFDEATSAMDSKTEDMIFESLKIHNEETTIIMVAHRLNTLINCDRVIELKNGRINNEYTRSEFIEKFISKNLS